MTAAPPARGATNLQLRLATAVIGIPLIVGAIYLGGWTLALVLGAVAVLAAAEFTHGWLFPREPIVAVLPQLLTFGASGLMVAGAHGDTRWVTAGILLVALFAAAGYTRTNRFGPRKPYRVQAWALLYIGLLMSTFVLVRDADHGRDWLFLGVIATFVVDTGAYATGRAIGRHKLAPRISPAKTIEGAVGGYVAGAAAVFALNALLETGVSAATVAPLALLMPLFSQAGDLFESWMKRRMGVKDASGLLPGHGGFLDRLDSLLFVLPLLYLFLRLRVL